MKIRKKLLSMLLIVAAVFLTACSTGTSYTPGKFTETGYESEFLGFRYTTPEGYTLADEESLSSMMDLSLDLVGDDMNALQKKYAEISIIYEMMVGSDTTATNANITLEKTNASLSSYLDAFKAQISALENLDVTLNDGEEEAVIAGATYTKLTSTVNIAEETIHQEYYLRKVGDRMMALTVTWYDDEADRDTMMAGFEAY